MRVSEIIRLGAERIYDIMMHAVDYDPPATVESMRYLASRYLLLDPCRDGTVQDATLILNVDVPILRYDANACNSYQMIYLWHETAEYIAMTNNTLFDYWEYPPAYSGSRYPFGVHHATAVETERHYMQVLHVQGHDISWMEMCRRDRDRRVAATLKRLKEQRRLHYQQSGKCRCGCNSNNNG